MKALTTVQAANVQNLLTAGKTVGQIAQKIKVKKDVVQAHIDAQRKTCNPLQAVKAPTIDTTVNTEVVDKVEATADPLAAMLAAATQQNEVVAEAEATVKTKRSTVTLVKVATSSSKDENGNAVQKRNTNLTTRAVAVFTSEKLKKCWMGTHIGFATKTEAGMISIMQNAPQKALAPLQVADDVVVTVVAKDVAVGHDLELAKAEAFDKYAEMGYEMLCRRAKVAVATVAETA